MEEEKKSAEGTLRAEEEGTAREVLDKCLLSSAVQGALLPGTEARSSPSGLPPTERD